MKEFLMRTLLASAMLTAVTPAFAHEGHGEIDFHWHGGDLLAVLAMVVAVGIWLWRRSGR
jgi:hydrogenase/urease accessory protein HupE